MAILTNINRATANDLDASLSVPRQVELLYLQALADCVIVRGEGYKIFH